MNTNVGYGCGGCCWLAVLDRGKKKKEQACTWMIVPQKNPAPMQTWTGLKLRTATTTI
jgi:hypothetical protein